MNKRQAKKKRLKPLRKTEKLLKKLPKKAIQILAKSIGVKMNEVAYKYLGYNADIGNKPTARGIMWYDKEPELMVIKPEGRE